MASTTKKPAVSARQSARSRAAEKMAERKKREKLISDRLEEFISAGLLIEDAEARRDEAIAKAHEECAATTAKARTQQIEHALKLKSHDLTDREIADLTDLPVSAVREMLKAAKKATKDEGHSDSVSADSSPQNDSEEDGATEPAAVDPVSTDTQIAS